MAGFVGCGPGSDNHRKTCSEQSAPLSCPFLSRGGSGWLWTQDVRKEERKWKREQRDKERLCVRSAHAGPPSSVGQSGHRVYPCVYRSGPWGPIAVTLLHNPQLRRTVLEVVSTSPSGNKTGLSSSKTIPEGICLSSLVWIMAVPWYPPSHCIAHSPEQLGY